MKRSKSEQLIELILEMANFGPKDHKLGIDIKFHCLQPGNKKLKHGPRLKVFRGNQEFVLTIENEPKIIGDSNWLNKKELEKTIKFVSLNKDAFLKFWNDSSMVASELTSMFKYK